jgi:hypothetical protein
MPAAPLREALALLATYGLQMDGDPRLSSEEKLSADDEGFQLYSDTSQAIGMDLASHEGEMSQWYSIPLKQRSEEEGSLSGVFVVVDGKVVGAGIHFRQGVPGVEPLSNKMTPVQ